MIPGAPPVLPWEWEPSRYLPLATPTGTEGVRQLLPILSGRVLAQLWWPPLSDIQPLAGARVPWLHQVGVRSLRQPDFGLGIE